MTSTVEDPPPTGRLSPFGAAMTVLEVAHMGALWGFLPILSAQKLFGGQSLDDWPAVCASPIVFWFLFIEAAFYILMKAKLAYLQSIDPQECYFRATNIMTMEERQVLWDRVMRADAHDMIGYFDSWFLDTNLDEISEEEFRDFVAWGYFDNRSQEHLNEPEIQQLTRFVDEAMERIRIQKETESSSNDCSTTTKNNDDKDELSTKEIAKDEEEEKNNNHCTTTKSTGASKNLFQAATFATETSCFSSDDDESVVSSDPMDAEDLLDFINPGEYCSIVGAYRRRLRFCPYMYFMGYYNKSSQFSSSDPNKQENPKDTSENLRLHQIVLQNALVQSRNIPQSEVAQIMRLVSQLQEESTSQPNHRFGRPTADPLLGVRIFPIMVHLLVFLTTELPAYFLFWALGFRRHKVGSVTYHYHPGTSNPQQRGNQIPVVFIHGIGVGPIVYLPVILYILWTTGRPLFVPEVRSVSAFRPWVMPEDALTPDKVVASLSLMLAGHGFDKATFAAHSFGTFWMSYMIKEAPDLVAGLVFLDPVNFCLKNSLLTQRVVYNPPDPGDIGYLIKTDMMVNWSVQRNFSWVRGNLFVEDVGDKPCAVFLSGQDQTAPSTLQKAYLESHSNFSSKEVDEVSAKDFERGNSVVVFSDCDHGLWMLNPLKNLPKVVESIEVLTKRIEKR